MDFKSGKYIFVILFASAFFSKSVAKPADSFFNFTHVSSNGHFFATFHGNGKKIEKGVDLDNASNKNQFNKIYGGRYASLGQFPFMAIIHRLAGDGQFFVCGGSILSKRWVLTAGHCIANHPRRFLVAFGVTDKSNFGYDHISGDGVSMIATQGALHPWYGDGVHDIGLLYMPKDIPFSDTIQPIRIAGHTYKDESFVNKMCYIFGWGKDHKESRAIPLLKYGRVPVISNSECRGTWGIDQGHICTESSSTGDDVCQGDSGGPLVALEDDEEPLQIGIVSYGDAGCPSDRPSVFTRVSAYAPWIKKVTGIHYE